MTRKLYVLAVLTIVGTTTTTTKTTEAFMQPSGCNFRDMLATTKNKGIFTRKNWAGGMLSVDAVRQNNGVNRLFAVPSDETRSDISSSHLSRRDYLYVAASIFTTACTNVDIASAEDSESEVVASAPVVEKVTTYGLASKAAIRMIKRASKKLREAQPLMEQDDYEGIKAALRVPPFSEVRKNCVIIIRFATENSLVELASLERLYASFKTQLETLDSQASLGMRGRNKSELNLKDSFFAALENLDEFASVAEKATASL